MTVEIRTDAPPPKPKQNRPLLIFGSAAIVVLLVVGAVAAVVAVRRSSFGARLASAEAMPADTALYVSIDFEGFGDLDRLLGAFDEAVAEAGLDPSQSVLDQIDQMLQQELGVSVDEVTPWIGRDAGIGMLNFQIDDLVEGTSLPQIVAAMSVRDQEAADAFLTDLVAELEARTGATFTMETYRDVDVHMGNVLGVEPTAMGRSGDLMLMATDMETMRRAIDSHQGESLRDDQAMEDLLGQLTGDRAITVFINGVPLTRSLVGDVLTDPFLALAPGDAQDLEQALENAGSVALGLALTDFGVRVDYVQEIETTEEGAADLTGVFGAPGVFEELTGLLPAETFIYFGIGEWDVPAAWQELRTQLDEAGIGADIDQGLRDLEANLGIDIERDVIDLLTGELGVGVVPSPRGLIAQETGLGVGIMAALGVTNTDAALATIDKVVGLLGEAGVASRPVDFADGSMFVLEADGTEIVAYGVTDRLALIGTDLGDLEDMFGDGTKLRDAEGFRELRRALGNDPLFYVNLTEALRTFDAPPDARSTLEPLRALGFTASSSDTHLSASFVAIIDY